MLLLQGAWVQFLLRKLRSHMPHCVAKKRKKKCEKQKNSFCSPLRSKEAGERSARGLQRPLLYPVLGMAGFTLVRTGERHQRMAESVRLGPLTESWILGLLICKSQMICACYLRSAENFK